MNWDSFTQSVERWLNNFSTLFSFFTAFINPVAGDATWTYRHEDGTVEDRVVPNIQKIRLGDETQTMKVAPATTDIEAVNLSQVGSLVGSVIAVASTVVPYGFLECNGAEVSRTTYADLYAVIGDVFGAGDGSTTFNLPDLRGEFIRGLDNGRGVDAGRVIGTPQGDAIRNITGRAFMNATSSSVNSARSGALDAVIAQTSNLYAYNAGVYYGADVVFDASWAVPTANENRPRNIAMMFCIKY